MLNRMLIAAAILLSLSTAAVGSDSAEETPLFGGEAQTPSHPPLPPQTDASR